MAGLSATGLGSGLDINSLVSQLVAAERVPQQGVIDAARSKASTQLSAFGSLKSSLSALRTAMSALQSGTAFNSRTATSTDAAVFTASAGSGAGSGSYTVEVQQLARAYKAASAPVASASTAVGTGTLTLAVGGPSLNITIDSSNNTLAGIRDAINQAAGNPGVTATLINADGGTRLVLTSRETGVANAAVVTSAGGDGGLDALLAGLQTITAAQDALATVDGFALSSASNTIADAVDGVSLTLTGVSSTPQTLEVGLDRSAISASLKTFVDAYNSFLATSKQLAAYDPATQRKGPLLGDSALRSVADSLSRAFTGTYPGTGSAFESLSALGIGFQVDGKLAIDQNRLDTAFDTGIDQVAQVFTSASGIAAALAPKLDSWLDNGGLFATRTTTLNQRTRDLDAGQARLDARITSVEARYRAQFTALDSLLAGLNSTSTFLAQQLATLNTNSN